jgi:hypothetical protein
MNLVIVIINLEKYLQYRIYFSLSTNNLLNTNSDANALEAMREQWWFNIFDPNNSQFQVNLILSKEIFLINLVLLFCIV